MTTRLLSLFAALCLLCYAHSVTAQTLGTLSFSPPNPTTADSIASILTPKAGQPDWCPYSSSVQGNNIYVSAQLASCPPGQGTTNTFVLGRLPAGTYQVTWRFVDNFLNLPLPTATLVVAGQSSQAPALSTSAISALLAGVLLFGLHMVRRRPVP